MTANESMLSAIKIIVQEEIRGQDERLEKKITTFKSEILTAVDGVMHEVKAVREEQTFKVGRDDRQDEAIENVKGRVTTVEKKIGVEPMTS